MTIELFALLAVIGLILRVMQMVGKVSADIATTKAEVKQLQKETPKLFDEVNGLNSRVARIEGKCPLSERKSA